MKEVKEITMSRQEVINHLKFLGRFFLSQLDRCTLDDEFISDMYIKLSCSCSYAAQEMKKK